MESADACPESTQSAASPPLESWWGHTGMLYVGASVFAGAVGRAAYMLVDNPPLTYKSSLSERMMEYVQFVSIYGATIAFVQWFALRRLVCRALRAVSGRDLSQTELRIVRNTVLWIVVTIAGMVTGAVFRGLILHFSRNHLNYLFSELINGLSLGTAQWLVLRRQVSGAGCWIPWTFGGAVLGVGGQFFIYYGSDYLPLEMFMINVSMFAANAAGYAILQAICLKRLAPGWIAKMRERALGGAAG